MSVKKRWVYMVFILLVTWMLQTGSTNSLFSVTLVKDRKLTDGLFYNSSNIQSASACATLCLQMTRCASFNYELGRTLCELNDKDSTSGTLVGITGVLFSDASSWNTVLVGMCGSKPCKVSETCIPSQVAYNCAPLM